jgi:multidrug efflux pump
MPRFFIDRPIFAWVVAILITLAGTAAIFKLPVSAYPPIAPPQVSITATYPGARPRWSRRPSRRSSSSSSPESTT